ncbi:MAG: class I SAM-dependent methyltransferase [Flavobacteriales bacterium]|nr:class I SAM-dependent methyltransferase [Flavobacteriales bacterium]
MRNEAAWKPKRILPDGKGGFNINLQVVYPGSIHIINLQIAAYLPLMKEHLHGRILDCACDTVPYYQVYKPQVSDIVCLDWEVTRQGNPYVDCFHDLNTPLPFDNASFDSILMTDALAHIKRPYQLFAEFARVLKPGGKLMVTSTFINWYGEPPHEYTRCSAYAFQDMCSESGLNVVHLQPYGGHADVLLDTLNKGMTGKVSNRLFRFMRSLIIRTGWYKKNHLRTRDRYPIGYCLVAQKPNT